MAEIKEKQADRIHAELKKAYKSMFKGDNDATAPIDPTTMIVWLKSKSGDDTEVKKAQNLLSKIVPPFQQFDSKNDWYNHLQNTELRGTIFLIADLDYENSVATDSHQFLNVQAVYRYGNRSSENDNDLCFQLLNDLAVHYNKLGLHLQ